MELLHWAADFPFLEEIELQQVFFSCLCILLKDFLSAFENPLC